MAHDVQLAVGVVQAQDQRADRSRLLARPVADDDRVDRPHPLDLDHPLALAGPVRGAQLLGDDALAAGQPRLGRVGIGRRRGQVDPVLAGEFGQRGRGAPHRAAPAASCRRAPADRTRRNARASAAPATALVTPPGAAGSAARRSPVDHPRRRSRSRRRRCSDRARTSPRGSSVPAAGPSATGCRPRRRRRTRSPGSRRTSAHRPTVRRAAAAWPTGPAAARPGVTAAATSSADANR